MLCAVNQAAYLLRRQLESQGRNFVEKGGFTESLYAARTQARSGQSSAASTEPKCPTCGERMVRRIAKSGPNSGQPFWGCSVYPKCKGLLTISNAPTSRPTGRTSQTRQTIL